MKTKSELKRDYKERKTPAGVFQIKNTVNGKIFLCSSLNLDGSLNRNRFTLQYGGHKNETLMKEWKEHGQEAFLFEILEVVKETDDPHFNVRDELALLEEIWLEKLQPFGERGYNKDHKIRQV